MTGFEGQWRDRRSRGVAARSSRCASAIGDRRSRHHGSHGVADSRCCGQRRVLPARRGRGGRRRSRATRFGRRIDDAVPSWRTAPMSVVLLVVHGSRDDAVELAETTAARLRGRGIDAAVVRPRGPAGRTRRSERHRTDHARRHPRRRRHLPACVAAGAQGASCPVLGVNFGRLGYLLEVAPEEFETVLDAALDGTARRRADGWASSSRSPGLVDLRPQRDHPRKGGPGPHGPGRRLRRTASTC